MQKSSVISNPYILILQPPGLISISRLLYLSLNHSFPPPLPGQQALQSLWNKSHTCKTFKGLVSIGADFIKRSQGRRGKNANTWPGSNHPRRIIAQIVCKWIQKGKKKCQHWLGSTGWSMSLSFPSGFEAGKRSSLNFSLAHYLQSQLSLPSAYSNCSR